MTETAVTLLTAPAILALVNLVKNLGLSGKWSALVAVVLGVAIACLQAYAPAEVVQTISQGLICGLGAAGLYDVGARQPVGILDRFDGPRRAADGAESVL